MEAQIMAMKIYKDNTITTTQQIPSFNEKNTNQQGSESDYLPFLGATGTKS